MMQIADLVKALCLVLILSSCEQINKKLGEPNEWWGQQLAEQVVDDAIQYETGIKPDIHFTAEPEPVPAVQVNAPSQPQVPGSPSSAKP